MIEALYAGCHVFSFCKPNKNEIAQWHIVGSAKEMEEESAAILNNPHVGFGSVTFRTINDAAKEMMSLLDDNGIVIG